MTIHEKFLTQKQRYQPIELPKEFSDEQMTRDWSLSNQDKEEINKYSKKFRLLIAIQLCAIRLYGRFLLDANELSPRIVSYLNSQLNLLPSLSILTPHREATIAEQRKQILSYLGFSKYDDQAQDKLKAWLVKQAQQGCLPDELFLRAERYLLSMQVVLPGPSILERLISSVCTDSHELLFKSVYEKLPTDLKNTIDELLVAAKGEQRSLFYLLKEYPSSATISSIREYLQKYQSLERLNLDRIEVQLVDPAFRDYLYRLTRGYNAKDLKRFNEQKRYCMMIFFLLETRRNLLDNLMRMHDQYIMGLIRQAKQLYEKRHREFRKRHKKAVDTMIHTAEWMINWPDDKPLNKSDLWKRIDKRQLLESINDLYIFKQLEEQGYGDILLSRYPSLRKYFSDFINLPFEAKQGNEPLLKAINLVRQLDTNTIKKLPNDVPTSFIPK